MSSAIESMTEAELLAQLETLATLDQAQDLLGLLTRALFPSGAPEIGDLTWPEDSKAVTLTEVTAEERAEARFKAAEARFRALVEQIPAVTFMAVLGQGENEVYVSPHVETLLGFTQKEWLEDPFRWYWQLHPDDREVWNQEFARGCRTGGPFRAECRFRSRSGEYVWVHGEARVVKDARGRPQFLQGVAFDITDNKKAQALMLEHAVRDARMKEELEIARRVQTSVLPRSLKAPGLEAAALMKPTEEVGGDYYDFFETSDGAWIAIGDVTGHGLTAGLLMLMLQSATAAILKTAGERPPSAILTALNTVLYENIRGRLEHDAHATMTLLRYTKNGRIEFTGAHEDMLIARKRTGKVQRLFTPGPWVGAMPDIEHAVVDTSAQLERGDLLVLHTDGIREALDESDEQYDMHRLSAAVLQASRLPIGEVPGHILRNVQEFTRLQHDDITIVALRYLGE